MMIDKSYHGAFGCKKSTIDKRDYCMSYPISTTMELPDEFMLEPPETIKDQKTFPYCASFSGSYIIEHLNKLYSKKYVELSPTYIYVNRPNTNENEGMELRDALKIMVDKGVCENSIFNKIEDEPQLDQDYISDCYSIDKNAQEYHAIEYAQVNNIIDMKCALIQNGYLYISVPWQKGYSLNYDICSEKPNDYIATLVKDSFTDIEGYHALTIIGYTKQGWICFNTWGASYGCQSKFILPYSFEIETAFTVYGNCKEPSDANVIDTFPHHDNVPTPAPIPQPIPQPIIHKRSDNEFIQFIWKVINWILNHCQTHTNN